MIRLLLVYAFNLFRILCWKLRYGTRCNIHWMERFHPSVRLLLKDKASVSVARNVEIAHDGELACFGQARLAIGDRCYFNNRLMVSCHAGISIGEGCLFGPDVKLFDNDHTFDSILGVSTHIKSAPIRIGRHCWLASNVVVLKGTTIGDNCIIGAGCVVKGNIPANSLVKQHSNNIVIVPIRS